jgi:hypothetical protein
MFDNFMEERKADIRLTDEVISELVDMGFEFDYDDEVDNFEGYPGMEYSLN